MLIVMLVPPLSVAVVGVKFKRVLNSIVRLVLLLQLSVGGVVSTTEIVWLHDALILLHASVATQVLVASNEIGRASCRERVVLSVLVVILVPPLSVAVGGVKIQGVPNSI